MSNYLRIKVSIYIFSWLFILEEYQSENVHRKACNCKVKCSEVQYSAKVSTFRYPSSAYVAKNNLTESKSIILYNRYCVLQQILCNTTEIM